MSLASDRIGFIFVRVPRAGSTTYSEMLRRCFGPDLIDEGGQHWSAVQLRALWGEKWDRYFTYGFIRNPWAWLVSFYNSGVSVSPFGKEPWQGSALGALRDDVPVGRTNAPFDDWVHERRGTPIDWLSDETGLIVDRVYRFEDAIPGAGIHESAMKHAPYRDWYTPALRDHVVEKCRREIEIGGYEF